MTTVSHVRPQVKVAMPATLVRFALGITLSAISGVMLLLAFPPYGLWPLAWFGAGAGLAGTVPAAAGQVVKPGSCHLRSSLAWTIPGAALWP